MSKIKVLNVTIDNLTMEEALDEINQIIIKKEPSYVVTPNVDHIIQLEKDIEFRNVYRNARLTLVDGMPLLWIAKLFGNSLKEKISGSDLFPRVCQMAALNGYRVVLLGAAEGVADLAAENLMLKYPGLKIVGTISPSYGFEKNIIEVNKIKKIIKEIQPDILVVGLGAPKQEKFIFNHYKDLKVPISLAIGASIDFEAGVVKRAPRWMQKNGLEWFYRLIKEPKRLYRRYLIDAIEIIPLIFKYYKGGKISG